MCLHNSNAYNIVTQSYSNEKQYNSQRHNSCRRLHLIKPSAQNQEKMGKPNAGLRLDTVTWPQWLILMWWQIWIKNNGYRCSEILTTSRRKNSLHWAENRKSPCMIEDGEICWSEGGHTFYMMEIPPGNPPAVAAAAAAAMVGGLYLPMHVRCVHYYSMPSSAWLMGALGPVLSRWAEGAKEIRYRVCESVVISN